LSTIKARACGASRRRIASGHKPWDPGKVSRYQKPLGLKKLGALVVGSRAVMIAKITGTEPVGVGQPGDAIHGLQHAADILNVFFGFPDEAAADQQNTLD